MSLVLLAGYMNTYTSNPAPIDPTGGFAGNTVTPFDYGTCPCHAAVQRSRDLVSVQRAATLAQSDQTAVAVNRSSNIVWTGKAPIYSDRGSVAPHSIRPVSRKTWRPPTDWLGGRHERARLLASGIVRLRRSGICASHS